MHILSGNTPPEVLHKKQGGSSGYLGGGSFGNVHLEIIDSECGAAPAVRAVKTINKRAAESSKIHWEQEIENLIILSQVFIIAKLSSYCGVLIRCLVPTSIRRDVWLVGRRKVHLPSYGIL